MQRGARAWGTQGLNLGFRTGGAQLVFQRQPGLLEQALLQRSPAFRMTLGPKKIGRIAVLFGYEKIWDSARGRGFFQFRSTANLCSEVPALIRGFCAEEPDTTMPSHCERVTATVLVMTKTLIPFDTDENTMTTMNDISTTIRLVSSVNNTRH